MFETRTRPHAETLLAQTAWVRALASRLVLDATDAEDLAQETLLKAWERPPRHWQNPGRLRAWLGRVARNLANMSARSESRRRAREHATARPGLVDPVEPQERAVQVRTVVAAVLELPEPYQRAVLLRYLDGHGLADIARIEGLAPAAARKRVSRGIAMLRERFSEQLGDRRQAWFPALVSTRASAELARASVWTGVWAMGKTGISVGVVPAIVVVGVAGGLGLAAWKMTRTTAREPAAIEPTLGRSEHPPADAASALEPPQAREQVPAPEALEVTTDAPPEPPTEVAAAATPRGSAAEVSRSFLTDRPDLLSLERLFEDLARRASVVEGSLRVEEGVLFGRLEFGDSGWGAGFTSADGDFQVRLDSETPDTLGAPFVSRDMRLAFRGDFGRSADVRYGVQFHPLTNAQGDSFPLNEERITGWNAGIRTEGSRARPMSMTRLGGGTWRVGNTETWEVIEEPALWHSNAADAWLHLLEPVEPPPVQDSSGDVENGD